jgi:hypothetical protein
MIDHPADWPRHRTHPRRMTPAVPVWPLNAFPPFLPLSYARW